MTDAPAPLASPAAPEAPLAEVVPIRRRSVGRILAVAAASVAVLAIAASVFVTLNKPTDSERIRAAIQGWDMFQIDR